MSNQTEKSNSGLTEQEIQIVEKILAGIFEVLNSIITQHSPEDYAKSLSGPQRRSKKPITHTSILYNVTTHKQNLPAEPRKIRANLPEDLKDINSTDLWKILNSLARTKFLRSEPNTIRCIRGRPKSRGFEDSNRGGKPSSHDKTEELKKVIDANTGLVVLSHALFNTGAILPVEQIGNILAEKNIPYFVDAAQTVGCLEDVDVNKINVA